MLKIESSADEEDIAHTNVIVVVGLTKLKVLTYNNNRNHTYI